MINSFVFSFSVMEVIFVTQCFFYVYALQGFGVGTAIGLL